MLAHASYPLLDLVHLRVDLVLLADDALRGDQFVKEGRDMADELVEKCGKPLQRFQRDLVSASCRLLQALQQALELPFGLLLALGAIARILQFLVQLDDNHVGQLSKSRLQVLQLLLESERLLFPFPDPSIFQLDFRIGGEQKLLVPLQPAVDLVQPVVDLFHLLVLLVQGLLGHVETALVIGGLRLILLFLQEEFLVVAGQHVELFVQTLLLGIELLLGNLAVDAGRPMLLHLFLQGCQPVGIVLGLLL